MFQKNVRILSVIQNVIFAFFEESDLFVKTLFQFVFLEHDLLFKVLD